MQRTFTLEQLPDVARQGDPAVRTALAGSQRTPAAILEILAHDVNWWTRLTVAENPKCSGRLLAQLAHDPSINVRCAVASSPKAPATTLVQLARDATAHVRGAVASNVQRTPRAIIQQLLDDPNIMVQSRARVALPYATTPMPKPVRTTEHEPGD